MDPLAQAKQKMASGQPLTRDEVSLISNAGVTSADINAVKNPPAETKPSVTQISGYSLGPSTKPKPFQPPKGNVIPTPSNPQNLENAKKLGGDVETYEQWIERTGNMMSPGSAKQYAANLAALVPKGVPAPVPALVPKGVPAPVPALVPKGVPAPVPAPVAIAETPITPVASQAGQAPAPRAPVPAAIPAVAPRAQGPVSVDQIRQDADAMRQFLKSNPDGLTLANILDVVGTSLSARGGVQRDTQLSKRKTAEMQFAQQQAIKAMDLDNQSKLMEIQLRNAIAQNNQEAALQIQNKLKEIEAQKAANIEQAKAVAGVSGLSGAGGVPGLINKYAGAGQ